MAEEPSARSARASNHASDRTTHLITRISISQSCTRPWTWTRSCAHSLLTDVHFRFAPPLAARMSQNLPALITRNTPTTTHTDDTVPASPPQIAAKHPPNCDVRPITIKVVCSALQRRRRIRFLCLRHPPSQTIMREIEQKRYPDAYVGVVTHTVLQVVCL